MLEKAWAKVKGSYGNTRGGHVVNGLRSLTGIPVYYYKTKSLISAALVDEAMTMLKEADKLNYLMGAQVDGGGDDSMTNSCGIN